MPVKSIKNMSLSEVPNFEGSIGTCRKKVSSVRVECYLINLITVSIIVLEQSLTSNIPDLNTLVRTSTSNASSIRVETNTVNSLLVVFKALNKRLLSNIP